MELLKLMFWQSEVDPFPKKLMCGIIDQATANEKNITTLKCNMPMLAYVLYYAFAFSILLCIAMLGVSILALLAYIWWLAVSSRRCTILLCQRIA